MFVFSLIFHFHFNHFKGIPEDRLIYFDIQYLHLSSIFFDYQSILRMARVN